MSEEQHKEPPVPPQAPEAPKPEAAKKTEQGHGDDKLIAALSYVGILFLVPLLAAKNDEFAQFHAKQGLVLFIVDVGVSFLAWIPFIGWSLGIACFIISVYGVIQTLQGAKWELPYLGKYAKQIKF